jgi:hypothetical protein
VNRWEKEVQQSLLDSEEAAIKELEKQYAAALKDISEKVKGFQADIDLLDQALSQDGLDDTTRTLLQSQKRSKIYQQNYQKALQGQVSGILDKMHGDNYATIDKYLNGCYETGYIGTMYDIAGQGVPLVVPIDQAAAVKAVLTDSKVSNGLYAALGVDVAKLKKSIAQEISRGIASSLPYSDIARNIKGVSGAPLSRAKTIARTEGHRIQQTSSRDAQYAAKKKGADVLKQWDATLDGRTRDSHARVDGEIKELDEKFSNGLMFPGDPSGGAAEVVNCRCTSNTRARWALDDEELNTLKERAEYFGLDKTENFEEFKQKYNVASKATQDAENGGTIDTTPNVSYIDSTYGATHAQAVKATLQNADPDVKAVWNKYQSKFKTSNAKYSGGTANYSSASDSVTLDIARAASGNSYQTPYQVLYHEYGHMTDYLAAREFGYNNYVAFTQVFNGLDANGKATFIQGMSGGLLGQTAKDELKALIKSTKKAHGVTTKAEAAQIIIDEIKKNYSLIARSDVSDMLEGAGIGVSYPLGVGHGKSYWKNRDNGKEIFAEMISAEVASPDSLACIKKYFPETYKVFRTILGVIK